MKPSAELLVQRRLLRIPQAFDHHDFAFDPKLDGFRALAVVRGHRCELVSRNAHTFKSWRQLAEEVAHSVRANDVVLDGEICCLGPDGRTDFYNPMFRREWPHFYAFDALSIDGEDLRALPLLERKRHLRRIMPRVESRLLYLDHTAERGCDLCRVCDCDLEGIVGKRAHGTYLTDGRRTSGVKVKNPEYSQMTDRHELFARRGETAMRLRKSVKPDLVLA